MLFRSYKDCDQYHSKVNGKYQRKDEMLWEFENMIVGISLHDDKYIINHYNNNFDKSEYEVCDMDLSLKEYGLEWFNWILETSDFGEL